MSKTDNDTKPELPAIQELTRDQFNRLLCADYLEALAGLIRKNQASGFKIAWDPSVDKPVGAVQIDSSTLVGPMEARITRAMSQAQAQAAKAIPVVDATGHEQCGNPACVACNSANNPNKS